jgi:hypothetical protein
MENVVLVLKVAPETSAVPLLTTALKLTDAPCPTPGPVVQSVVKLLL